LAEETPRKTTGRLHLSASLTEEETQVASTSEDTTMKYQSPRGVQSAGALANCTYRHALTCSGSGLCSVTESAASRSWVPVNHHDSRPRSIRTQSIRSTKCHRLRNHHRRKKLSRTQSHAATSKVHHDQIDDQTDVLFLLPARSRRKVNVSSTRKYAKTVRRNTFRGPVPFAVRLVNQIVDVLVRAFVGKPHIETNARMSGG
jgi:hypothetical protein